MAIIAIILNFFFGCLVAAFAGWQGAKYEMPFWVPIGIYLGAVVYGALLIKLW